ncbi:RNA-binding motif protein, X-linked 2-like [Zootermopsis nevadensis]|uniref:RNA-binding motif protein, X-linked 2 n=1 Tax=Zootermopsis nevadensis TaxID=136037 RepID=A0A067RKP4_ZOONE|nr:RNA-binding motif protein, X-linked 2-like [Zootermopsis nevadensis]KDR24402.1 RNA-binding motif protein, X-linked 2 [Zootermopsis nevadensis]
MNPMTNVKNIKKLSELELKRNLKTSWHDQYKDSAWIFVGGLPYDLTEGDIICVFSQYGEVVNLNLVRDKATGKSKGFCFLCYEDQHSTVLAVDNLNGIKLLGRTIRVDHVADYKPPKDSDKLDEETRKLYSEGCAPSRSILPVMREEENKGKPKTKSKKEKKKKKKKKRKQVSSSEESSSDNSNSDSGSESDKESDDSIVSPCNKKHKHSSRKGAKKRKKKSKVVTSDGDSSTENETIRESREKRRKLVEKIKTLEAVLNYTRKASKKASATEEPLSKPRSDESLEKAHVEHYSRRSEKNSTTERGDKQKNTYHENGTLDRKQNHGDSTFRRQEQVGGEIVERDDRQWKRSDDTGPSRDRERFRAQERIHDKDRDWEHDRFRSRDKERFTRERGRDRRWDRGQERCRR